MAKESASWDATVHLVVQAWLQGSVPTAYAVDTLKTGNEKLHSARYSMTKDAIERQDRVAVERFLAR